MDIIAKLASFGVPQDIIAKLNMNYGETLFAELKEKGLKAVCEKAGIDASQLPDIDMAALGNVFAELTGTDTDGDGKTGIMEAVDTLKNMFGTKSE